MYSNSRFQYFAKKCRVNLRNCEYSKLAMGAAQTLNKHFGDCCAVTPHDRKWKNIAFNPVVNTCIKSKINTPGINIE